MEGWDGTRTGGLTEEVSRRWTRFGESGAKMIWGGEAMAVQPEGRANPNQLIIIEERNKSDFARFRERPRLKPIANDMERPTIWSSAFNSLTHSGRFCRPNDKRLESRVAYRHPILDKKFNVTDDSQVSHRRRKLQQVDRRFYVRAARIAWDVGADFVDIKHCHGYLLHEFLSARTRPRRFRRLL